MRVLIVSLFLVASAFTLVAATPSAGACTPPNCGTHCYVEWTTLYYDDSTGLVGGGSVAYPSGYRCLY